jgi:hypothetical protein
MASIGCERLHPRPRHWGSGAGSKLRCRSVRQGSGLLRYRRTNRLKAADARSELEL